MSKLTIFLLFFLFFSLEKAFILKNAAKLSSTKVAFNLNNKEKPELNEVINDELFINPKYETETLNFKGEKEDYTDNLMKKSIYELNEEEEEGHLEHLDGKNDYKDFEK